MFNPETGLPERLDVLTRDLHQIWCEEEGPADWHRAGADPEGAAIQLAQGLWDLGTRAAEGDESASAALMTLASAVAAQ